MNGAGEYCIRVSEPSDLLQLRQLWELCFPEDAEFNKFFFDKMYTPEAVRLISQGGGISAALYIFPYSFANPGKEDLQAYYIYGVGTHPNMRGHGLAGELLRKTLNEARSNGQDLCVLVPQNEGLFSFYEKFGFTPSFSLERRMHKADGIQNGDVYSADEKNISELNRIYENGLADKIHIKRTRNEWQLLLKELELSGGGVYLLKEQGKACAYATHAKENGTAVVREIMAEDAKYRSKLLNCVAKDLGENTVYYYVPGGKSNYGSVCLLSEAAQKMSFADAYMNLMHS